MSEEPEAAWTFSVYAEEKDSDRPLIMNKLPWGRLVDEIIVPYNADESFFLDGAPTKRSSLRRFKVIREDRFFSLSLRRLHTSLHRGDHQKMKIVGEQYQTRLEAICRDHGEDVTAQVVRAFDEEIRPKLANYLPKREELIRAAWDVFLGAMKALGGGE